MSSVLFPVGVLLVSAVTAADLLHDRVHDGLKKRKARKAEKRASENENRDRDRRHQRRRERANSVPTSFAREPLSDSDEPFPRSINQVRELIYFKVSRMTNLFDSIAQP
jgi:hypothetical protein